MGPAQINRNKIWNQCLSIGIDEHMPFGKKRSVRALNLVGFLGALLPLILSTSIWYLRNCDPIIIAIGLVSTIAIGFLPLLNHLRLSKIGAFIFNLTIFSNVVLDSYLVGPGIGIEYAVFYMLIGAFTFSTGHREILSYSILGLTGIVCCIFIFNYLYGEYVYENFALHLIFGVSTVIFSYVSLSLLKLQNETYEKAIEEKNTTLEQQKQELTQQHENLSKLHLAIREKNEKLGLKNFMVTESLNYAKRIQFSTLPNLSKLQKELGDCFVYFKPKDIVSGDFYWYEKQRDIHYFAIADCTGHGVPGAFMSLVGTNILHQIVREAGFEKPSEILNELDARLTNQLEPDIADENTREGMDITLCALDQKTGNVTFASAGRPVYLLRNCQLTEYKGTRAYVGRTYFADDQFTDYEARLEDGDTLYLFTDGFIDQFDVTDKRKYGINRLKSFLPEIFYVEMKDQMELVRSEFERWKGHTPQTDDVLMFGYRYRNLAINHE